MTTSTTENEQTTQSTNAAVEKPEAPKKARAAARSRHVTPSKGKSGKNAAPTKKGAKARKQAGEGTRQGSKTAGGVRQGSKTEKILDLLKRPGGVTTKELMKATGWLPHSVRGFISGTVGKKMDLAVTSAKGEDGERSYSING